MFYDINKLPKDYGILVFPISISRMEYNTGQSAKQCFQYVRHFSPKKVSEPKIGLNMIYGDSLYLNSPLPASTLKQRFITMVLKHRNAFQKLIQKNFHDFQIQHAFSYEVWNQLYLSYAGDLDTDLRKFKKFCEGDELFQKYLREDAEFVGRELDSHQVNFFLEESLLFYLLSKKKISLPNDYIQGREKWVLWCYPGVPLKCVAYTYQKNFFKLETPENPYQNHAYDLQSKKLINFLEIDLEKYNYKV